MAPLSARATAVLDGYTYTARLVDYVILTVDYDGDNPARAYRPVGDYTFNSTTFGDLRIGDVTPGTYSFQFDEDGDLTVPHCTGDACDPRATWFNEIRTGVFQEGSESCSCMQALRNFTDTDTTEGLYGFHLGPRTLIFYNDDDGVFSDDNYSHVYSLGEVAVFELLTESVPEVVTAPLPGTAWLLLGAVGALAGQRRLRRL